MISSYKEYLLYIEKDRYSKFGTNKWTISHRIKNWFLPDQVWKFQKKLRKLEYLHNCKTGVLFRIYRYFVFRSFQRLSVKLGFSIPINVFGPGLAIVHYGTIVINPSTRVGANCRIHTCVNIGTEAGFSDRAPVIGDNCYIGPGAKIFGNIKLGNGIAVGANAVVNKSFLEDGITIAGVPANKIGLVDTSKFINISE